MKKTVSDQRITALDGVRGIAILLVVLTHVTSTYLQPLLPPVLARAFFSSGITGVSLLFILSGFFMALMYPEPKDRLAFIQKRYTRIFPLFLMMCALTMLVRVTHLPWYGEIAVGIGLAGLVSGIWVRLVQQFASVRFKRWLFLSFIALQVTVGCVYFFWIMRQPSVVFTQQWSPLSREVTIGLVNGTLTLPLGDYIPMIDGVYWSLAAEVLFYVLYATLLVPIITRLISSSRVQKLFLLILLIPFFGGLHILASRLFGLSLLQPAFGYYFVTGIVIGYLYRHKKSLFASVHRVFFGPLQLIPVAFFFACLFLKDQSFQYVPRTVDPWLHIFWAIPLTVAVALTLDPDTLLARVLRSKIFVFLGTISYSMYLSHSLIIHIVESLIPVTSVASSVLATVVSLVSTVCSAYFLYTFLEKPYFNRAKQTESPVVRTSYSSFFRRPLTILSVCTVLFIATVLFAYQSNFNFFSSTIPVENLQMITPANLGTGKIDMTMYPNVRFEFISPDDEFGVMTMKLLHVSKMGDPSDKQRLQFSIKEKEQTEWYATNTYALEEIGDGGGDPYGFPVIKSAHGKTYEVDFSLTEANSAASAILDVNTVSGVYTVNKKDLLKSPLRLLLYTKMRVASALRFMDAKKILWYVTPTFLFVAAIILRRNIREARA